MNNRAKIWTTDNGNKPKSGYFHFPYALKRVSYADNGSILDEMLIDILVSPSEELKHPNEVYCPFLDDWVPESDFEKGGIFVEKSAYEKRQAEIRATAQNE